MRLIDSNALDSFFFYISHKSRELKEVITPHHIGDFTYYDCEDIIKELKPKAKRHFVEFLERNPIQVHEYNE